MRSLTLALAAALALTVAGCGQKSEKKEVTVDTGNGKVTVNSNGNQGQMSITSNDGKSTIEFNTANAKLPAFVPTYPGATVTNTITGTDGNGSGGTVVFTTADSPQTVIGFYKQRLGGMKEAMAVTTGDAMMWSANDEANKRGVQITASKAGDGKTQAQVIWQGK
jgi:hypothetical protein